MALPGFWLGTLMSQYFNSENVSFACFDFGYLTPHHLQVKYLANVLRKRLVVYFFVGFFFLVGLILLNSWGWPIHSDFPSTPLVLKLKGLCSGNPEPQINLNNWSYYEHPKYVGVFSCPFSPRPSISHTLLEHRKFTLCLGFFQSIFRFIMPALDFQTSVDLSFLHKNPQFSLSPLNQS